VLKAALITFGIGMALIVIEYIMAGKKKEGVTPTDKRRMVGLFWLSIMIAGLVASIVWVAD
jgi:hypothetical protein